MECKNCGKNIDEFDSFCKYCGNKIEKTIIKPVVIEDNEPCIFEEPQIIENNKSVILKKDEPKVTVKEINKPIKKNKRKIHISTIIISITTLLIIGYSILFLIENVFNKEEELEVIDLDKRLDNLKYVVPSDFTQDSENSNSIHKYSYIDLDGACQLKIVTATASYYDSVESYLEKYIENIDYVSKSKMSDEIINDVKWKNVLLEKTNGKVYYYASSDNTNIYKIEFDVTKNESVYCKNIHTKLLDSLHFKK